VMKRDLLTSQTTRLYAHGRVVALELNENRDRVLIVDCTTPTQIARVVKRSGLSPSEVEGIIQAQSSRSRRLKAADFVIFNEGKDLIEIKRELEELEAQFGL